MCESFDYSNGEIQKARKEGKKNRTPLASIETANITGYAESLEPREQSRCCRSEIAPVHSSLGDSGE